MQALNGQALGHPPSAGQWTNEIRLLWLDLDQVDSGALNDAHLSEEERQRAARFATPTLRRRYMTAHLFMRHALAQVCTVAPAQLRFVENAWGKPALADASELHFSLSHSQHLALLGISKRLPIGVDIEVTQAWPDDELRSLAQTIMTAAEQQALLAIIERHDNQQPTASEALLTAWTRKEACVKALGLGLSYDVRDLETGITADPGLIKAPAKPDSLPTEHQLPIYTRRGPADAIVSVATDLG